MRNPFLFSLLIAASFKPAFGEHLFEGESRRGADPALRPVQERRISDVTREASYALSSALDVRDRLGDKIVSPELLKEVKCVISMRVTRGAFLLGGNGGEGVMSCRTPDGGWSAPSYVRTGGFELSAAIGFDSTDVTMFVTDEGLAREFKNQGNFSTKAYASAVAASASAALTASRRHGMAVVQTNNRGLYAGVGVSFSSFSHMQAARNQIVYQDSLGGGTATDRSGTPCSTLILPRRRQMCIYEYETRTGKKIRTVTADMILKTPAKDAPQITRPFTELLEAKLAN